MNFMKLVYGIGINDSDSVTIIDGKIVTSYVCWKEMLRRCYDPKSLARHPTYVGCYVDPKWLSYATFKEWFDKNHIDGYHLDKDLLFFGNKEYSENNCVFVPSWLNSFVIEANAARGKYMLGVYLKKQTGKFAAMCGNPLTKKQEHLGYFLTEIEAHEKWKEQKCQHIDSVKVELDLIDTRLYVALKNRYK